MSPSFKPSGSAYFLIIVIFKETEGESKTISKKKYQAYLGNYPSIQLVLYL